MKNWSLRLKLILVTGICILTLSLATLVVSLTSLQQKINEGLEEEVNLVSSSFSLGVSNWMMDRRNAMKKLAKVIAANPDIPPHIFLDQVKEGLGFSLVYFGTPTGAMYRNDPTIQTANYDPRERSWYKGVMKNQDSYLAAPFVAASTGNYVITLAEPVRDANGKIIGVVGGNLTLQTVADEVNGLKIPGDGYSILVDKSDQIVAHAKPELQKTKASALSADFTGSALQALEDTRHLTEMQLDNRSRFIFANAIPNTSWTLILVMDKNTLMAPVRNQAFIQVGISLTILVLVALILSWLIKLLLGNLVHVTAQLNDISNGEGDLTQRIQISTNDEIGQLAGSFNRFLDQLHGIISRLSDTATHLKHESDVSADDARDQAERVNRHQDEIHMVATAVTEMSTATQEISNNAENTAASARGCLELSEEGQRQMQRSQQSITDLSQEVGKANTVIAELNQHAQDITSILSTISGIAEQTNLLALNAAIEAARAGDQGRGFAVVADEVRVLSQRTHDSTQEIQEMIEALQNAANRAVKSTEVGAEMATKSVEDVGVASERLQRILESIHQISDMSAQIAAAAEEQSSTTIEINRNTEAIGVVGDQMAEAGRKAAEQADQLKQMSQQITQEVNKFKL